MVKIIIFSFCFFLRLADNNNLRSDETVENPSNNVANSYSENGNPQIVEESSVVPASSLSAASTITETLASTDKPITSKAFKNKLRRENKKRKFAEIDEGSDSRETVKENGNTCLLD